MNYQTYIKRILVAVLKTILDWTFISRCWIFYGGISSFFQPNQVFVQNWIVKKEEKNTFSLLFSSTVVFINILARIFHVQAFCGEWHLANGATDFYILTRFNPPLHTPTANGVKTFPKVLVIFEHKLWDKVFFCFLLKSYHKKISACITKITEGFI